MTSGQWITYYVPFFYITFILWEFIQLARRRAGNKSAYTLSQYVTRKARASSKWRWILFTYVVFHVLTGVWLLFHFELPCIMLGRLCDIHI